MTTFRIDIGLTPELEAIARELIKLAGKEQGPARQEAVAESIERVREPEPAPEPEPAKPLTTEDVRAAMERARRRIEGEDYKDNTEGEGYQRYHRALTAKFKQISSLLGKDKPSALEGDAIRSFIVSCDHLTAENGGITEEVPF